jgi:4-hydroxybenzoate polyprenyltransferase and related prenyltransferases
MRVDRPVGTHLLAIPCLWAILASITTNAPWADVAMVSVACLLGAFITRSLGCVVNDLADRKMDAKVARTKNRPLASGQITVTSALIVMVVLGLLALALLPLIGHLAAMVALAATPLILTYPLMKRITHWPQAMLGLCMNWGFLVAWASLHPGSWLAAMLIFAGAICWTIAYDTIYAFQDRDDDRLIGVGSTAIMAGDQPRYFVGFFYAASWLFFASGWFVFTGPHALWLMLPLGIHFAWQYGRLMWGMGIGI